MTLDARPTVAVLGGGITGLAAAWALAHGPSSWRDPDEDGPPDRRTDEHSPPPRVIVLEAGERFGGRLGTVRFAGLPIDTGADAFITRHPAAEALCRDLGLGDELVAPASSGAFVWARGKLRPLPSGLALGVPTDLPALARSGIVSPVGVARAAADLVLPRRPSRMPRSSGPAGSVLTSDPSVADVLGWRLGRQVLEQLIDPLVGGINAGAAARLSFAAVTPQLASVIDGHRSAVWALGRQRRAAGRAGSDGPAFLGLSRGLQSLVERLVERLATESVELRTGYEVDAVVASSGRYRIRARGRSVTADGLIIALPGQAASAVVANMAPAAAAELARVNYASVSLVTLTWAASELPNKLPGSGFLVPRSHGLLVTACTFTSSKWPHSSVPGRVVLRASVGRAGDDRASLLTDAELVARVREELALTLGITAAPLATLVTRHERAFPQYEPGHLARVEHIRAALAAHPSIAIAGAALDGIGIPACIASGQRAAAAVTAKLGGRLPAGRANWSQGREDG